MSGIASLGIIGARVPKRAVISRIHSHLAVIAEIVGAQLRAIALKERELALWQRAQRIAGLPTVSALFAKLHRCGVVP